MVPVSKGCVAIGRTDDSDIDFLVGIEVNKKGLIHTGEK